MGLDLPSSPNLSLYISKSPGVTAPIDVFIDDIRLEGVTAVPEPSSLGLAMFGSAAALLIRRKRRSRSDFGEPWVSR
ncbi:MAG: PEP-CTERM sorting domain-containing protein [Rhodopirellula sp. JB053]